MELMVPVIAIEEELTLEEELFLDHLQGAGQTFELWSSWSRAGELRRDQWMKAWARVSAVEQGPDGVAMRNFGATWELTERLLRDRVLDEKAGLYFNPRGGGCAHEASSLPDLEWAALRLGEADLAVGVVDLDAHGPLLELLGAGAGDHGLMRVLRPEIARMGEIDVLIVGGSSDGLEADGRSELNLSTEAYEAAGLLLGDLVAQKGASILLAGGTGSLTDSAVPGVWASLFSGLSSSLVFTRANAGTDVLTTPPLDTIDVTGYGL